MIQHLDCSGQWSYTCPPLTQIQWFDLCIRRISKNSPISPLNLRQCVSGFIILTGFCNMWQCLLWCSGPLRQHIRAPSSSLMFTCLWFDRSAVCAELQTYRHTDCTDNGHLIKNSLRVVSNVLWNGLYVNTDVMLQWNMRGGLLAHEGGGMAGNPWPAMDF
jgi:hypothetical protein